MMDRCHVITTCVTIIVIIRGSFGRCAAPVLEEVLDGGEQEGEEVRQRERHQHEAEVDQHGDDLGGGDDEQRRVCTPHDRAAAPRPRPRTAWPRHKTRQASGESVAGW